MTPERQKRYVKNASKNIIEKRRLKTASGIHNTPPPPPELSEGDALLEAFLLAIPFFQALVASRCKTPLSSKLQF